MWSSEPEKDCVKKLIRQSEVKFGRPAGSKLHKEITHFCRSHMVQKLAKSLTKKLRRDCEEVINVAMTAAQVFFFVGKNTPFRVLFANAGMYERRSEAVM